MKRYVRKSVLLPCAAIVVVVYGCQTVTTHMGEGERLYLSKCTSCHRPVAPESRTPDQWSALLENHGPKLKQAERSAILSHLAGRSGPAHR